MNTYRIFVASVIGLLSFVAISQAHDLTGKYANSPLHAWFDKLASKKGLCCSYADGYTISNVDWRSAGDHYEVRVPTKPNGKEMIWVVVPTSALVTVPNRAGKTMVWPLYTSDGVIIQCFMLGAEG